MSDEDTLFPSAPELSAAFENARDTNAQAPEQADEEEEEQTTESYDAPSLILTPGGEMTGIRILADAQAKAQSAGFGSALQENGSDSGLQEESKDQNIDDILNRASVMLNEDWQKATDPANDPTEGYEP
jgi:hypothetical protein